MNEQRKGATKYAKWKWENEEWKNNKKTKNENHVCGEGHVEHFANYANGQVHHMFYGQFFFIVPSRALRLYRQFCVVILWYAKLMDVVVWLMKFDIFILWLLTFFMNFIDKQTHTHRRMQSIDIHSSSSSVSRTFNRKDEWEANNIWESDNVFFMLIKCINVSNEWAWSTCFSVHLIIVLR